MACPYICVWVVWGDMKTTLEIKDDLLMRAKKLAKKTGRPLRAIVEDSLRATLQAAEEPARA